MDQPITDQVAFLSEACRAQQERLAGEKQLEEFRAVEKQLEKDLETEKKAVSDSINTTVKKRVEEINQTYDKEIAKGQDRLKKIRSKREKAKSQGVKERIQEETSELKDQNRELTIQMKTLFQQDRVPRFCRSDWYYSLYFTRGASEFLILLLTVSVCFLIIPCAVYLLLLQRSPYYLAAIYFITILVFGGLYILINNKTKVHHQEALKKGRAIRDQIRSNKKKIRVITGSIKRDRDEAVYDLEKYDDEIAQIEQELAETTTKKKDALNTFEKVTKTIISDEIAGNSRERVQQLERDYQAAGDSVREAEKKEKEQTLFITDHYETYVGKEFMAPEKLDELADYIRLGKASTISEAESLYKNLKG